MCLRLFFIYRVELNTPLILVRSTLDPTPWTILSQSLRWAETFKRIQRRGPSILIIARWDFLRLLKENYSLCFKLLDLCLCVAMEKKMKEFVVTCYILKVLQIRCQSPWSTWINCQILEFLFPLLAGRFWWGTWWGTIQVVGIKVLIPKWSMVNVKYFSLVETLRSSLSKALNQLAVRVSVR